MRAIVFISLLLIVASTAFAQRNPRYAEFCSLFSEGTHTTRPVRIKALMTWSTVRRVDGGDSFFYGVNCNNQDYFAVAEFSRVSDRGKTDRFLGALAAEKDFVIEADVTGQLVNSFLPLFGHLSWSRASFEIDQVHSMIDVGDRQDLVKPNFDAKAPLTEFATSLQTVNSFVMMHFLGASSPEVENMLAKEYVAIDPLGRSYDKASHKDLSVDRLFDDRTGYPSSFVSKPDTVKKVGGLYIASGRMGIESASGVKREIRYENAFRATADSIHLMRSRFTKP